MKNEPIVYLDSARTNSSNRYSYLFCDPIKILKTNNYTEVHKLLKEIDDLANDYWLAGYVSYEIAYGLEERLYKSIQPSLKCNGNLIWFGVFEKPFRFDHVKKAWEPSLKNNKHFPYQQYKKKNKKQMPHNSYTFSIEYKTYEKKIRAIKRLIARGETYQVNFTFDATVKANMSAIELYTALREHQKTPFCSYLNTGEEYILSFSPELFFKRDKGNIYVKPMKGTAPRGRWDEEDRTLRKYLKCDEKNRSENIMIVDLLRNDLGKICETRSIKPRLLFNVETHPTLHQMTSTIKGMLKPSHSYSDIFAAIFPSGSVTGAPKIRTMEIIHALEEGKRGVYCGAIGFISPREKAVFSVPIRTLQKKSNSKHWTYRVGSGIVWDSSTQEEWQECKTKCQFLTTERLPKFELFETVLWNKRLIYIEDHMKRLKKSAHFFNYPFFVDKANHLLKEINKTVKDKTRQKVRLFLNAKGSLRWDSYPIEEYRWRGKAPIFFSKDAIDEKNIFLYHKTTHRPWYDEAMNAIRKRNCYDMIFINSKGEITEGARTNIFVKKGGIFYTPPLSCGLLDGILRQTLIRQKKCFEKTFTLQEVRNAEALYCGNSVRGLQEVQLICKEMN